MGEREWWANVYPWSDKPGWHWVGREWPSRERAAQAAATDPQVPTCRIHVRLKPKGAPRRYASEYQRKLWERHPKNMRRITTDMQGHDGWSSFADEVAS